MCDIALQCVAVKRSSTCLPRICSVLQCFAVCYKLLQWNVAVYLFECIYGWVMSCTWFSQCIWVRQCKSDKKLLGCGFSILYTLLYVICTISSELNYFVIFTHLSGSMYIRTSFVTVRAFWQPRSCHVCTTLIHRTRSQMWHDSPTYTLWGCTCLLWVCFVLQCAAVYCNVLQCAVVCCSVLQCVAVCCSVLQCDAVCCSVMQCVVAVRCRAHL